MRNQTSRPGVTLVEILVVLAIVTMLASAAAIVVRRLDMQAKEESLKNTFTLLEGALGEYYDAQGQFPVQTVSATQGKDAAACRTLALQHNQQVMEALQAEASSMEILNKIDAASRKNLYLPQRQDGQPDKVCEVYDPWGTAIDYVYAKGDNFPSLRSAGPDTVFGTADDVANR